MSSEMDFLLNEFVAESREMLSNIESDLLIIEKSGANFSDKLINNVFRAAHSIKGASGLFGFTKMQELAHKTETVLDMIRTHLITPDAEVVNILLMAFDKLRDMINQPNASNEQNITENIISLTGLATAFLPTEEKGAFSRSTSVKLPDGFLISIPEIDLNLAIKQKTFIYFAEYDLLNDIDRAGKDLLDVMRVLVAFGKVLDARVNYSVIGKLDDEVNTKLPLQVLFATDVEPKEIGCAMELPGERVIVVHDPRQGENILLPIPIAPSSGAKESAIQQLPSTTLPQENKPSTPPKTASAQASSGTSSSVPSSHPAPENGRSGGLEEASHGDSTIRVSLDILENLMNLAGELVLSRNQLREALSQKDEKGILSGSQRINLVTTELQEVIMQTRMQPIGNVFGKFPRLVRDLTRELKKEINLQIEGKEVEMDKTLVEGLNDPLTHMVRNACDHGIELPEKRVDSGKKAAGTVSLRAYHEAGQVVIEITDDGKGIDPERLAAAAIEKGLVSQDALQGMSEKEKIALIFLPGLSTAEKVTGLSGRGVGMDVVKTNLDHLGGKIEIDSKIGKGSLFRIKLPLTLAIIPSLLFSAGQQRFAIPQINVVEILRIPVAQIQKRIEIVSGVEVLNLRGKLVPLVVFREILGLETSYLDKETLEELPSRRQGIANRRSRDDSQKNAPSEKAKKMINKEDKRSERDRRFDASGDLNIIIVTTGLMQYGVVVDQLYNNEEIVVKPLGRHLKGLQEYAGATIMGDGKVALIIDSSGLAAKSHLKSVSETKRASEAEEEALKERRQDIQNFLLFFNGPKEECAIPLEMVRRVERITKSQIEFLGGRRTMQYRGVSLPLVTLSDAAKVQTISENQELLVVVSSVEDKEVGLLVTMPVDALETKVAIDQTTMRQKGVAGSFILKGRTIMVVDIYELVQTVHADWAPAQKLRAASLAGGKGPTIILAEDSDFFRSHVKRLIESEGINVIEACNGLIAWQLLEKHASKVNAVLTDIEMPEMTGLELTRQIRKEQRFANLPVIGLTSLAGEQNIEEGKAAGITEYLVKLDQEKLRTALHRFLSDEVITDVS
ncbi:MAG: chemotaxis protein CheW [Candidatus Riflebacteria bacterium]|nr:chemotaxis protein CheW [Candidatus Riflebacteria bacterium]